MKAARRSWNIIAASVNGEAHRTLLLNLSRDVTQRDHLWDIRVIVAADLFGLWQLWLLPKCALEEWVDGPLKLRNPCSQRDVLRAAKEVSRPRIARGFDGLWPHYERQTLRHDGLHGPRSHCGPRPRPRAPRPTPARFALATARKCATFPGMIPVLVFIILVCKKSLPGMVWYGMCGICGPMELETPSFLITKNNLDEARGAVEGLN